MNLSFEKFAAILLGIVTLVFMALLLNIHIELIATPVPVDIFEGIMPAITHLIISGHIPFTAATEPVFMDPYPPLYNFVVAPFALWFGNTLFVHRVVGGVFIVLSCWIVFYASRKKSVPVLYSLVAACLLYAALMFYSTPVASTNGLGVFLFLASVIAPWLKKFTWPGLYAGLFLGIMAFYAKQYFIFGPLYVALYVFLFESKLRAIKFCSLFAIVLVLSLVVINQLFPYFIGDVILSQRNALKELARYGMASYKVSFRQALVYIEVYFGLVLLIIFHVVFRFMEKKKDAPIGHEKTVSFLDMASIDAPLISPKMEYFAFCFVCSMLIVVFYLGKNPGNYMTYFFQLMSPFLLLSVFDIFKDRSRKMVVLSLPLLCWCLYSSYSMIHKDFTVDMKPWRQVERLISNNSRIFASPMLVMLMIKNDKELYDAGQAWMFQLSMGGPWFLQSDSKALSDNKIWGTYEDKLRNMVKNKQFDLLLLGPHMHAPKYYRRYYRRTESYRLNMTDRLGGGVKQVDVWRPK